MLASDAAAAIATFSITHEPKTQATEWQKPGAARTFRALVLQTFFLCLLRCFTDRTVGNIAKKAPMAQKGYHRGINSSGKQPSPEVTIAWKAFSRQIMLLFYQRDSFTNLAWQKYALSKEDGIWVNEDFHCNIGIERAIRSTIIGMTSFVIVGLTWALRCWMHDLCFTVAV